MTLPVHAPATVLELFSTETGCPVVASERDVWDHKHAPGPAERCNRPPARRRISTGQFLPGMRIPTEFRFDGEGSQELLDEIHFRPVRRNPGNAVVKST